MRKKIRLASVALIFALMLFSCAGSGTSCKEMFTSLYGKSELSVGRIYLLSAKEWEDGYLSDELFSSLYSTPPQDDASAEMARIEDCAVYLSSSLDAFCEIGIFLCYSNTDTAQIAKMCQRRISLISSMRGYTEASALKNARVEIKGRYVIYSLLP